MNELFEAPGRRRRSWKQKAFIALSAITAAGAVALPAGIAGATGVTIGGQLAGAANNIIVGSGSSTTYTMMTDLGTLYNEAPGCTAVVDYASSTAHQPFDFSCLSQTTMTNGKNLVQNLPTSAGVVNPYNDVTVEETPIGSSNGILQLETSTGNYTAMTNKYSYLNSSNAGNIAAVNFARSSRTPSSSDDKGLNFVAYAKDAVSWVHYKEVNGNPNVPSDLIGNRVSISTLEDIYNGQIYQWNQIPSGATGATATTPGSQWVINNPTGIAPIYVFSAQEGSGTQSTWKSAMGNVDPSSAATTAIHTNCFNISGLSLGLASFSNSASQCDGAIDIFENEYSSISGANALTSLPTNLQDPNYPNDVNGATGCTTTAGGSSQCTVNSATVYGLGAGATVNNGVYTLTGGSQPAACASWYLGCTQSGTTWTLVTPTAGAVMSRLIFFYSSGLWHHQCIADTADGNTAATCANGVWNQGVQNTNGATIFDIGAIGNNGGISGGHVQPSGCSASTHQNDTTPCLPTEVSTLDGDFPVIRYVYNVYGNGSQSSAVPAATAPTLNFISETGFLCTPNTGTEYDPATGATYLSEIQTAIENNGFYPLSAGATSGTVNSTPIDEGIVPEMAASIYSTTQSNSNYSPYAQFLQPGSNVDQATSQTTGYCLVSSTDSTGTTP